jgi:organic radical activating enzyme
MPQPLTFRKQDQTEISEIFSSLQGEGPYLGVKQIFVRFGRCNMHCHYCDELQKMKEERFQIYDLPALLSEVEVMEQEKGKHHSVSLTGGEPLLYAPFLMSFMPALKAKGFTTYLETNGTLPEALNSVLEYTDIIAMDMKPASSTGDRNFEPQHRKFLEIASRREVFIKVVVTPDTAENEVARAVEIARSVNSSMPFIFQPLSDAFGINTRALKLIENSLFEIAKKHLSDVRVIPQMHKIWGVR